MCAYVRPLVTNMSDDGRDVAFLDSSVSGTSRFGLTASAGCKNLQNGSLPVTPTAKAMSSNRIVPFLKANFLVFVKIAASESGIEKLSNHELLAKAAR